MLNQHKLDTQQVEIVGRNILISLFMSDGIEVAMPQRDRGIDLIAYKDLDDGGDFRAVPIQLKAFSRAGFGLQRKYEKFPNLRIAYVWFASEPLKSSVYVLSYKQAEELAQILGWTKTASWDNGSYVVNNPGARIVELLEPYKYAPTKLPSLIGL